jgi:hypothetical protein
MADVIRAVRWRLQFPIGYRDLKRMLADRGWIIRPCRAGRGARRLGVGEQEFVCGVAGRKQRGRRIGSTIENSLFTSAIATAPPEPREGHHRRMSDGAVTV